MSAENSTVLMCAAADADAVNAAVAELLGNPPDARNLSVPVSKDGSTITHYAGHGWFTNAEVKLLSTVPDLEIEAAVLDRDPYDNWLSVLKAKSALSVKRDEADPKVITIEPRREPQDAKRIEDAKAVFEAKPREVTGIEKAVGGGRK
jgi:hypothetical protein